MPSSTSRIAVVGAGPVGATLALALSRASVPVALVERRDRPPSGYRPVALSYASRRIIEALGAWSRLASPASPIVRVHVSQRGRFGATRLDAADYGMEALGWVSDIGTLVGALHGFLSDAPGVRLFPSTTVAGIARHPSGIRLELSGAAAEAGTRTLEVDAVIAADGGQASWCADLVETVEVREYGQVALGALVRVERDHRSVAYERFTPEGPIALLPMRGRACVLVWTLAPERGRALALAPEARFLDELHRAFGDRLGRFLEVGRRETLPLRRTRARAAPGSRVFLAGAAANTLHPVAGQALNLGLRDAAVLAEVIAGALRTGVDPGSETCSERYRARRRRDQRTVGLATDLLARGFLPELGPLALLRAGALVALDLAPPAKRALARHAMGLGLPQCRLVRGIPP